ncbi:hypothetical protein GGR26_003170 [Lewinella marina]|uniref:TonB C-terminal domain-containing protein n=1 Tax=Neolewinella marina TaxID=438751 RepID=A0A2G0CE95_9BACT|nr:hypothetical protein [Neolewinella marina]NJB87390.1 hypothetical protein [Neolewinella marina]PHK98298.1 hypothetical protein CGL56_11390 [Neolewinella marina]
MLPATLSSRFFLTGLTLAMLLTAASFGYRQGYGTAEATPAAEVVVEAEAQSCDAGPGFNPMKIYGLPFAFRPKLPPKEKQTLPIYPGCEGEADYEERVFCGFRRLLAFIEGEQRQPPGSAAERVFVKVMIDAHGRMQNPEVARGTDPRNRREALRVVRILVDRDVRWTPATVEGVPRARAFVIPFSFHGAGCSL